MDENEQELYEMYGDNAELDLTTPRVGTAVRVFPNPSYTEIEIDGKKMQVVSPKLIAKLQNTIGALETKIKLLEQDVRNLRSRMYNTEASLHEARQELTTKISYE